MSLKTVSCRSFTDCPWIKGKTLQFHTLLFDICKEKKSGSPSICPVVSVETNFITQSIGLPKDQLILKCLLGMYRVSHSITSKSKWL